MSDARHFKPLGPTVHAASPPGGSACLAFQVRSEQRVRAESLGSCSVCLPPVTPSLGARVSATPRRWSWERDTRCGGTPRRPPCDARSGAGGSTNRSRTRCRGQSGLGFPAPGEAGERGSQRWECHELQAAQRVATAVGRRRRLHSRKRAKTPCPQMCRRGCNRTVTAAGTPRAAGPPPRAPQRPCGR